MAKVKQKKLGAGIVDRSKRSHGFFVVNGAYFRREAVHAVKAFVTPLMGVIAAVSSDETDPTADQKHDSRKVTEEAV